MFRALGAGVFTIAVAVAAGAAAQGLKPYDIAPNMAFDAGKTLKVERREGDSRWTRKSGAVDNLKLSLGGEKRTPDGLPAWRPNDDRAAFQADGFDVAYTRAWPSAVDLGAFSLTPHAGVSLNEVGGGAEAGATLSMADRAGQRLKDMGLRDGSEFGDRGRWYMFAAASGRSVGLNMLRGEAGLERAGWSTDAASALVSDAQAGVGWRRGPMQASLGYLHREVKPRNGLMGLETKDDDLVAFTFSFAPH